MKSPEQSRRTNAASKMLVLSKMKASKTMDKETQHLEHQKLESETRPGALAVSTRVETSTLASKLVLERLERSPGVERRQHSWRVLEARSLDVTACSLHRDSESRERGCQHLCSEGAGGDERMEHSRLSVKEKNSSVAKSNNNLLDGHSRVNSEMSITTSTTTTKPTATTTTTTATTTTATTTSASATPARSACIQGKLEVCASSLPLIIPTFTVTINPMEANEVTFVPDSPTCSDKENKMGIGRKSESRLLLPTDECEVDRRSSIGSASSLQEDKERKPSQDSVDPNHLSLTTDLGIRRVSDISHINELRQGVSGMEHLASEYYEITRDSNPDNVSLDSIHRTVFERCQHKYIRPERSSRQNQMFVIITSACTIMGILYGFWYKNFGPGNIHH